MRAGALDQRIVIERQENTYDRYGQPITEWVMHHAAWAAVEPLQGREYVAALAAVSEVTARIRLRYVAGIDSTMRVIHGADTYGIESVIHVRSAQRELQLKCRRVA